MENDLLPKFTQRTIIDYKYLREFKDKDFNLTSRHFIDLLYDEDDSTIKKLTKENLKPYFILFMSDSNTASKAYLNVWLQLAQEIKDDKCYLGFCNLEYEKNVKEAFKLIGSEIDHPYYWARYKEVPFMMVYREGFPQGFYNSSIDIKSLIEFCIEKVSVKGEEITKTHLLRSENLDNVYKRQAGLAKLYNLDNIYIDNYDNEKKDDDQKYIKKDVEERERFNAKIGNNGVKDWKNQLVANSVDF